MFPAPPPVDSPEPLPDPPEPPPSPFADGQRPDRAEPESADPAPPSPGPGRNGDGDAAPIDDPEDDEPSDEHDVLVRLRLSNRSMGVARERDDIERLAEQLEAAVLEAGVGEYDGEEIGAGECTLFFAGPDADRLFLVLQPLLHRHPMGRQATVVLQYGAGDPVVKRV